MKRPALRLAVMVALLFCTAFSIGDDKRIGVWMSPAGPWGIWQKSYERRFPVEMTVKDLADLGITEIFFFEQCGRGGTFLHPTKVKHAVTEPRMQGRDFLKELLHETAKYDINVWLAWTTPHKEYPETEIHGLNNPELIRIYLDEIEEIVRNYGNYKNLAGIMWHEVDCTEYVDDHEDDVPEFAQFCEQRFGERYEADKMPEVNPDDKWWRRSVLYRNDIVNSLVEKTGKAAAKHGLKSYFCFYAPECFRRESWRWGYDVIALEKRCAEQWFTGFPVESGKPYQTIEGAWIDFGLSYRKQIPARNLCYAFHGGRVSYFEYRSPVYIEQIRRYYSGIPRFIDKYGDFYNDYLKRTEKEVSLFLGKENVKKWLGLITSWQGGATPARIAVGVNPMPFIMKHPKSPLVAYDRNVRPLMADLTSAMDVDGFVIGSRFAIEPNNLRRYSLLIIPQDMGFGLTDEMATSLREYVKRGGKLLVMSTPLRLSRPDLTEEKDLTSDLCGVEIEKPALPGYIRPISDAVRLGSEKFWAAGRTQVRVKEAEVLVKEEGTARPLLTQKGTVFFSTMGYSPDSADYFRAIVSHIARPPVTLSRSDGLRILESVRKNGLLCLSFWGTGKAVLHVDTKRLGMDGTVCRVKDIITGRVLGNFAADRLRTGIQVEIKYVNQPFVLAIGPQEGVDAFKGIYPSEDVFKGMTRTEALDNPEVPL